MTVAKRTFPSTSVGQSVVSKSCSFFPFIYSLIYTCTGSSFPAPVLESAISWKSPGSFKWREHLNPLSGCSVCVCVLVAQLCLTLCNSMDCSLPGSSVHGIIQASYTGVYKYSLLQRIFPTQESNLGLSHCRQILYWLSYREDILSAAL